MSKLTISSYGNHGKDNVMRIGVSVASEDGCEYCTITMATVGRIACNNGIALLLIELRRLGMVEYGAVAEPAKANEPSQTTVILAP